MFCVLSSLSDSLPYRILPQPTSAKQLCKSPTIPAGPRGPMNQSGEHMQRMYLISLAIALRNETCKETTRLIWTEGEVQICHPARATDTHFISNIRYSSCECPTRKWFSHHRCVCYNFFSLVFIFFRCLSLLRLRFSHLKNAYETGGFNFHLDFWHVSLADFHKHY